MTITPALQRIYASAPDDETVWETLEIRHPLFAQTHYLTNAALPFTASTETGLAVNFLSAPFSAKLPARDSGGQQDLALVLDNVDREVIEELERAAADPTTRISVVWRGYASSDLSGPGVDPIALSISDISANDTHVEATASRTDVLNRPFPSVLYTTAQFPGLDR